MADVLKLHVQETEFLQRVAPLIRHHIAKRDLERICEEIIKIATSLGLPLRSFPLLAAISCLYEDYDVSGYNVARKLIKLGGGLYTNEKAYNALSDMRGLLFYFAFRGLAKTGNGPLLSYVTADQAALLFGCGLNVTETEWIGNQLRLKMELTKFLFPRMTDGKREELACRIQEG